MSRCRFSDVGCRAGPEELVEVLWDEGFEVVLWSCDAHKILFQGRARHGYKVVTREEATVLEVLES